MSAKISHMCVVCEHLCLISQDWVALVDMPKMEWKESVNLVFDYFCERTPRSFVEARDTSVVWNYKYAGAFCRPLRRDIVLRVQGSGFRA